MIRPLPPLDLDTTLAEASRVLSLILPAAEFHAYDESVSKLLKPHDAPLRAALLDGVAKAAPENSAHAFRTFLLSRRDPLFQCMTLPSVLRTPPGDQLSVAACLLYGVATLATAQHQHLSVASTGPLDREETDLFLGTIRRVGLATDHLVSTPSAHHIVVWCNGHAFSLDVLNGSGLPFEERAIAGALYEIKNQAALRSPANPSVASLSWNLSRPDWFAARQALEADPVNRMAFKAVDTALVTVALEPFRAPADPAGQLEAVRDGRNSVNRYADQVVGLVVFEDGVSGLVADHAPVDGGMANLFGNQVASFHSSEESGKPIQPIPLNFVIPSDLSFSIPPALFNRAVRIAEFGRGLAPEIINPIYTARLVPFMIHMAVQAAIQAMLTIPAPFFVQPSSMRHFLKGRSDPSYPISSAAFALIHALNNYKDVEAVPDASSFTGLFATALHAHKTITKAAKRGTGIGRHLELLRYVIDQVRQAQEPETPIHLLQPLVDGWAQFDQSTGPIVYITGFDLSIGVQNSMGNLYTDDQLSCWYNLSTGAHSNDMVMISLTLAGSGVFAQEGTLDRLIDHISRSFATMAHGVLVPYVLGSG